MSESPASCRVTVVMTVRERHALTLSAIDSVLANTSQPFQFLYLDVQSPSQLRAELRARAEAGQFELHCFDEPMWPQVARRRIVGDVIGDFVMFLDNDVTVEPGWLDALVRCADETGAGIVAPLYLWSDGIRRPRIHMAGGLIIEHAESERRVLDESHYLMNADPEHEVLERRRCDFAEFHGMLIRRELLDDSRMFDPAISCVHEHIDTALVARELGFECWFEPAARLTYLAFAPYTLDDLPLLRSRWNLREAEASIAAFAQKWNVIDDARSFGGVRSFLEHHVSRVDPVRPSAQSLSELLEPMHPRELVHTRSELLDLAQQLGYSAADLISLSNACARAQMVMNAGYRPCGRPFLNHLIGTAGILLRYRLRIQVVAAGLLHALYTHCPPIDAGPQAAITQIEVLLGGRDSPVERLVHDYTLHESSAAAHRLDRLGELTTPAAEVLMIVAANEIEMHLSGEIRYSGRSDTLTPEMLNLIDAIAARLGVPGLAQTLRHAVSVATPAMTELQTQSSASYRISGRTPAPMDMLSDLPRLLKQLRRDKAFQG
ncbi:MAG: glycosyltransferase [Rhodanobacteraceae bacterium]|nr:glycosyltransferase [Rhodanobacteraceae bacterium]MBP9155350.1 glycosyltransferase [Xanthomonadales bacterium]